MAISNAEEAAQCILVSGHDGMPNGCLWIPYVLQDPSGCMFYPRTSYAQSE